MSTLHPLSHWRQEQSLRDWVGVVGTVISMTGEAPDERYALMSTPRGNRTVRVQALAPQVQIGDTLQLWLGQTSALPDGRITHGLIAHAA